MRHNCLSLALVGLALAHSVSAAGEPRPVKIVARGAWLLPTHAAGAATRERRQVVLRSERELAGAAGAHALAAVCRALEVDAIDFKKQMLLAVSDGTLPMVGVSGGGPPSAPNRVEIVRVARGDDGKTLLASWRLAPRESKGEVITHPLALVLVDRFAGRVQFDRLPTRTAKPDAGGLPAAGKRVKVLARAFFPDGWKSELPARQWTVRSRDELIDPRLKAPEEVLERMRRENAQRYAKALNVDAVDFDRQMIVGVSAGVQAAGSRVEIVRIEKGGEKDCMTVHWKLKAPAKKARGVPAHPAAVALVGQFAGTVKFVEERRAGK